MKNLKKFSILCVFASAFFLTSCVETVIVGSAATATIALREKTLENTAKDVSIVSKLEWQLTKNGLKNPGNSIEVTVNEGRVLLTGVVRKSEKAALASQLAWKVEDVKEVIDELQIEKNSLSPKDFSKSLWDNIITLRVEAVLLFARDVATVNYKVNTVRGNVYLIGVAQDNDELQRVLAKISKIRGVKKIVNYVILADDARRR